MYRIRMLDAASCGLARLDKAVARRIVERIDWLAENLDRIRPEPLSGDFADLFKLRVGDYRIGYEVIHGERLIVVHVIGHRREVYRKR